MVNKKYRIALVVIILLLVCTIFVATSYALWTINVAQEDTNIVTTGCFDAEFVREDNPINLVNAYPIKDADGLQKTPFTFTIKNTCSIAASYEMNLEALANTDLGGEYLRVSLDSQMSNLYSELKDATTYYDTSKSAKFLTKGNLGPGESITFDLRLWLDYNATLETTANKTFQAKIIVINTATSIEGLANKIEIGDYIHITPTAATYEILPEKTGYSASQTINPQELNLWRVIQKNGDGSVDVVSVNVSSVPVHFQGQNGYMKLAEGLNTIASQYTNDKYVNKARHMGYNSQTYTCTALDSCNTDTDYLIDNKVVGDNANLVATTPGGVATAYWLASRVHDGSYFGRYITGEGTLGSDALLLDSAGSESETAYAIRPILTLKATLEPASGDGKSPTTPYTFD